MIPNVSEQLGELVKFIGGGTPSRSEETYWNGSIPWVTVKDFGNRMYLSGAQEHITLKGLKNSASNIIQAGNILLVTRMAVGRVALNRVDVAINQDLKALICGPKIETKYLLYFLHEREKFLMSQGDGATVKGIKMDLVENLAVPLPSLDEQKRIAAVLERADHLRRTRRFARTMSDTFLQGVFLQMFGDFDSWPLVPVEELAKNAKNSIRTGPFGSQLLHSEFVEHNGEARVLGIDNAADNRFKWGEPRFITTEKYESLKRYRVFPDDVLITIMGTLGRCAIVPPNIGHAINTKHLCCITLDTNRCEPMYLQSAFLLHPLVLRQLGVSERGAIMLGLNMGLIKELAIPLPPIEKQQQFAAIVRRFERVRAGQIEAERQAEHLFQTLLHRAFAPS